MAKRKIDLMNGIAVETVGCIMKDYYILITENASPCIRYMASQLQNYIEEATSIFLPIENKRKVGNYLSLGLTDAVSEQEYRKYCDLIHNEGFSIVPEHENIFFIAKTDREIAYSVYDYLERFYGIRFLTSDCEYVPHSDKIVCPSEPIVSDSAFYMRTYLTADIFQTRADYDFVLKTKTNDVFTELPEKFGGSNKVFGRESNHNFHCYVPFEKYGNSHPEFYRFFYVNGQICHTIDLTNGITEDGELDESTDLSVAKIVIEELKKDIIANPNAEVFNFTQEDGEFPYESGRNSRMVEKYTRSGILIRFCNVVVRKLNEFTQKELNGRKIKLVTFAYLYTKNAPVKHVNGAIVPIDKTVVADQNLIIQLALFTNGMYSFLSEKQSEEVQKSFREWKEIASEFWFWGYDIDFHRYLAFFNSFGQIKKNVDEMKKYGITYLCVNGPYESHFNWQANIRAYAYRKLMWDVNQSPEELMNEYIDIYYNDGAQAVRDVIQMFEEYFERVRKNGTELEFIVRGTGSDCRNIPVELLNRAILTIRKAEELFDEQSEYAIRLQRVRFSFEFFLYDNRDYYYKDKNRDDLIRLKDDLFAFGERCGIDYIGERTTIQQQKIEEDEKFLNSQGNC